MLKGQDVVVLLKLSRTSADWTVRSLAGEIGLSSAGVHRSLRRLSEGGIYDLERRRLNRSRAEEFLVHAVPYLFPARLGGPTRGVRTAWAAPPLAELLARVDEPAPVWPHRAGKDRGVAVEPLHPAVPEIASRDAGLGEDLALIDAVRLGDARARRTAAELLSKRIVTSAH